MDVNELAKALFGKDAKSNLLNSSPGATTTVYGTAMSDSENGEVQVFISDDAVGSDFGAEPDATIVTLPTSPAVKMGDTVAVTLLGGNTVKHPYVSAVIGSGDLTQSIAAEAQRIAEATGQHFWADETGIHVTSVTEEEWKDEDSETYHSGMNMLSNSQGQLFRDAENILLAITTGDERGVSIFDGYGNSEENVVSSYTKSGMTIGKPTTNQIQADAYGFKVINPVYGDVFDVGHTASSIEHKQFDMMQTVTATPSEAGVWTKTFVFTDEVLAHLRCLHRVKSKTQHIVLLALAYYFLLNGLEVSNRAICDCQITVFHPTFILRITGAAYCLGRQVEIIKDVVVSDALYFLPEQFHYCCYIYLGG